jgi:hypothetical protein
MTSHLSLEDAKHSMGRLGLEESSPRIAANISPRYFPL